MMLKRTLNLSKLLNKGASLFLFGARGTGKSSLVREQLSAFAKQSTPCVTLDLLETDTFEKYLKDPSIMRKELVKVAATKRRLVSVFIDEIQRLPALLNEVHGLLANPEFEFQFILTGSSARKLKRESANMLAGRALSLRLHPLTQGEWNTELDARLLYGSLPGIAYKYADDHELAALSLRSYVSTYLKEEIQQEALVRKLDAFARFLEIAGQYHAKTINAADMARAAGVSPHTLAEYVQILQDTLVAFKVPGWSASVKKQLRTTPKLYFFDNGVANAIRGELNLPMRESTARYGEMFEAMVMQEFVRSNDYHNYDLKLSYWRTNAGIEVDLLLSRGAGQPLAAIEIKSATNPERKLLHGVEAFRAEYPEIPCFCVCRAARAMTTEQGIEVVPYQELEQLLKDIASS